MLNKTNKLKQGVTLIEIIIYTALTAIVLLVVSNMLLIVLGFWQNNQAKKDIYTNTSFIVSQLKQDVHDSYDVITPTTDSFGTQLSLVSTDSGQIDYTFSEGRIWRNSEPVTDEQVVVSMSTANEQGFRKIGHTIDWQFILSSIIMPLTGTHSSQLVKGTALLSK